MLINTTTFQGEYPRIADQLLPENAATSAIDCRFLSGALDSWHDKTLIADAICKMGTINTVYLMDDQYWLQWTSAELGSGQTNVDVARGPIEQDTTERTIFTGTDAPRITNIAMATGASGCYPQASLLLGVPAPTVAPILTVNSSVNNPNAVSLTNGGAEAGDTSGWVSTGDFVAFDDNDVAGLLPQTGNFFFGGGTAAVTTATQNLDATTVGVFAGQTLIVSWYQAAGANMSTAFISIIFKDDLNVEISRLEAPDISYATPNVWNLRTAQITVPSGTDNFDVVQTYTRVGAGDNDAYIDTISLSRNDASASYDGSSLAEFTVGNNSGAGVVVNMGLGLPAPCIHFFGDNDEISFIHKNFNLGDSATYTVDYDFIREPSASSSGDNFNILLSASASGVSSSLSFTQGALIQSSTSSWLSSVTSAATLATYPSITDHQVHVSITVTKNGVGTASVDYLATDVTAGGTTIASGTVGITTNGDYLGWTFEGDGGDNDNLYLDNIVISISSPSSSGGDTAATFTSYVYTYVNSFGQEGPPSPVSRIIQFPTGGSVDVEVDDTFDATYGVESIRLYRAATSNGLTDFLFVAEFTTETYLDDTLDADLGEVLQTVDWDLPPTDGKGVLALPNGVTAMFSKNQFCPSVINQCHAYPIPYRLNFESNIVAHAAIDTSVVIGTETYPYMVIGSDPSQMSSTKFEQRQACVSKRSMVSIRNYGVVYASPDGLVAINGAGGLSLITDAYFSREEWQALNPSSIVAYVHDDRYYGFYDNGTPGGFVFDPRQGGNGLTFLSEVFTAGYSDPKTDTLYLVADDGELYAWDDLDAAKIPYDWRGKLHRLPRAGNFRAFQVRADSYTNLTFRFYSNGTLLHTQTVTSEAEKVMPPNTSTRLEMRITGTDRLWQLQVAEEMEDLQ